MPDYYIRTPDHEDSRGPFDASKLQTLAEAGQVTENTLYYDEVKEEWLPIALNEELKSQVFPQREKLSLKAREIAAKGAAADRGKTVDAEPEKEGLDVESMLAAAEGETDETRHLKKKAKSFEKAAALATSGIGLMMLLSAALLLQPHSEIVRLMFEEKTYSTVLNFPFLLLGLFDLLMAVFLFLAVTEVYPLLRARGMLTFGFGLYLGWALGDPFVAGASAAGGFGIFLATFSRNFPTMVGAMLLGIGGNGYLAYLAFSGRFVGFFEKIQFNIISGA